MKRVFISDCEGPISKNDNAYELTSHFVPEGKKIFTIISKYDDVLADVLKRENYKAGDTLKLILPFLKAFGASDKKMKELSAKTLVLIPNIKITLDHIRKIAHAFIISTSYEHYIKALCGALGFPYENTRCTRLSIDKYHFRKEEKTRLEVIAKEIAKMVNIEIPLKAQSLEDFSENGQETVKRLDGIFWKEITNMGAGRIFHEVNPIGGREKAQSIRDIVNELDVEMKDVMYVGDSITDVEALKLVKENDGLSLSFNGNQYAIKNAEIAALSENSLVTALLADVFCRAGKHETRKLVENWSTEMLRKCGVNQTILDCFLSAKTRRPTKVKIITTKNMEILSRESSTLRKKVRGEAVGGLG